MNKCFEKTLRSASLKFHSMKRNIPKIRICVHFWIVRKLQTYWQVKNYLVSVKNIIFCSANAKNITFWFFSIFSNWTKAFKGQKVLSCRFKQCSLILIEVLTSHLFFSFCTKTFKSVDFQSAVVLIFDWKKNRQIVVGHGSENREKQNTKEIQPWKMQTSLGLPIVYSIPKL